MSTSATRKTASWRRSTRSRRRSSARWPPLRRARRTGSAPCARALRPICAPSSSGRISRARSISRSSPPGLAPSSSARTSIVALRRCIATCTPTHAFTNRSSRSCPSSRSGLRPAALTSSSSSGSARVGWRISRSSRRSRASSHTPCSTARRPRRASSPAARRRSRSQRPRPRFRHTARHRVVAGSRALWYAGISQRRTDTEEALVQGSVEQDGLTRRGLLAGASAAVAAGALAATPPAEARRPTRRARTRRRADVIVVGAGAAGSAAGHAVAKAGRSGLVLEARDRVGGRTLNHELGPAYPGRVTEIGGTFVGPTQDHMYALLKDFGLGTFPTYDKGETVSVFKGPHGRFSNSDQASYVNMGPTIAADLATALLQLDQMAATVPVQAPWTAPNAVEWDSQTLDTWARANLASDSGRRALAALSNAVWGTEPRDMSLLYAVYYVAAAGNEKNLGTAERLTTTTGGAQQDRVIGGSQKLWLSIAADLGKRHVVFKAPVTRIRQTGRGVTVISDRGTFTAKRAIVAMPPALMARIRFDPQLPALRDQLVQRFPMGSYAKFEAVYDRPFWRDDGTNGQAFGDQPVSATFDQSPPDGTPGIMAGFIGGEYARTWDQQDDATRRKLVLDSLAQYFGPRMLQPIA